MTVYFQKDSIWGQKIEFLLPETSYICLSSHSSENSKFPSKILCHIQIRYGNEKYVYITCLEGCVSEAHLFLNFFLLNNSTGKINHRKEIAHFHLVKFAY